MVFDTIESSQESGQPIELYEFRIGTNRWRRTSSENDVTLPSTLETYTAAPIERGPLRQEVNDPTADRLEVRMPADDEFVTQFRNIAPGGKATLTLFRLHRGDLGGSDDRAQIFKGTVRNVSYADNGRVAVVQTLPLTSAAARSIPRRTYQGPCNHQLYDSRCTIDKDSSSFKFTGTVSAVNGDVITVTGAGAFNALADFFQGGYVEFENDFRDITAQSGDDLTLITPFLNSPNGETVIARAGCQHRLVTDCQTKFSNEDNFGGFPYVPKRNPYQTGID